MNPIAFLDMLKQENPIRLKDSKQLDRLLKNHPYFQIGLAVKTKYLNSTQHIDFINTSRKTAVIFPERSKLYHYLNIADSISKDSTETIIKPIINQPEIKQDLKVDTNTEVKKATPSAVPEQLSNDSDLSELEKNYLAEAINQSIQLDATKFESTDKKEETSVKENEILSFSDWLGGKTKISPRQTQNKLIADFISEDPIITQVQKIEFYSPIRLVYFGFNFI